MEVRYTERIRRGRRRVGSRLQEISWLLVVLTVLIGVNCLCRVACSLTVDPSEEFKNAFLKRSDRWMSGAVDDIVSSIGGLQEELNIVFSQQQVQDIALGLQDRTWGEEVTDWMHPAVRKLNKLRIVHGVRTYLVKGPVDTENRKQSLLQAKSLMDKWVSELIQRFPEKTQVITEGAKRAYDNMVAKCKNPLRTDYMAGVGEDAVAQAQAQWQELVSRFSFGPQDTPQEAAMNVRTLFLRATRSVASAEESIRAMPAELALAEEEVSKNIGEISEWQRIAFVRKVEQRQKHGELMSDMKADLSEVLSLALDEADLKINASTPVRVDRAESIEAQGGASNGPPGGKKAGEPRAPSTKPEIPRRRGSALAEGLNSATIIGAVSALMVVIALVAVWLFRRARTKGGGEPCDR